MDYLGGSTVITRVLTSERWRQKSLREDVMAETEGKNDAISGFDHRMRPRVK